MVKSLRTNSPATQPVSRNVRKEEAQRLLAWLPIPILLVATVILFLFSSEHPHEFPHLLLACNLVFSTLIGVFVLYLVVRSYQAQPSIGVLMFACGLLSWSLAGFVVVCTGLLAGRDPQSFANISISIHNGVLWLSAFCFMMGAFFMLKPRYVRFAPRALMAASHTIVAGGISLWAVAVHAGWTPTFFIQGSGGTPVRLFTLSSASAMFILASMLLMLGNRTNKSAFIRRYALALALIAMGLIDVALARSNGSLLSWMGRSAQYLSGIYMLAAAISGMRDSRAWHLPLAPAFRKMERRYQQLFENMTEAFALHEIIADRQGCPIDYRFLEVNPAFERITGLKRNDLLGHRVLEVLPNIESHWIENYGRVAMTGEPLRFENYAAPLNRWYEVFAYQTEIGQFATLFTEITSRKRAQEALRIAHERLALAQQSAKAGIWDWNLTSNQIWWSSEMFVLFGLDPNRDKADFETFRRIMHPDDRVAAEARIYQAIENHIRLENEYRIVLASGQIRWIHALGDTLYDPSDTPQRMSGICTDITPMKEADEALKHAKEEAENERRRLEAVMEALPVGVAITDSKGGSVRANAAFENLWGKPRPLVADIHDYHAYKAWWNETGKELMPEEWASVRAVQEGKAVVGQLLEIQCFDGTRKQVINSAAPIRDVAGEIGGAAVVIHDVSELRQTQEALRSINAQLEERIEQRTAELHLRAEQLTRLASELTLAEHRERKRLAQILHDGLQQLLVAARFRVSVLEQSQVGQVREEAGELSELLSEAIETSRTLTAELSPPILYEGGLVSALEWLARWTKNKYGLTVRLEAQGGSSPLSENLTVLLFQSIRELLFNVVKHSRVKSARVEVQRLDSHIRIEVSDKGVGFDPAKLQMAGGKNKGFGVMTIRERIGLMGGHMEIQSAPGQGSRFILVSPVVDQQEKRARPIDQKLPVSVAIVSPPEIEETPKRIRVVLADDHLVVRQGLASLLGQEKSIQIVGEASDGRAALQAIRQLRPDIVLMDISMPGMNGIEATRLALIECPEVKIIGLSMHDGDAEMAKQMLKAGAVAYACKSGPGDFIVQIILSCCS
jgi:PAS domain S-box-containing protein